MYTPLHNKSIPHPTKFSRGGNIYNNSTLSFYETQRILMADGWPSHAFDHPVEIVPNVWLSGVGFAEDLPSWCYRNGFTHIVNASGSYGRVSHYKTHPRSYAINYLELDIDDLPECSLFPFLPRVYEFIMNAQNVNGKILVHCIWGQSRSVSCLLYFIMTQWLIKYDQALEIIRRGRPGAYPNEGFENELRQIEYSRNVNLSTPIRFS
jgi:hypothetical protein